jgi:hypothetical protein
MRRDAVFNKEIEKNCRCRAEKNEEKLPLSQRQFLSFHKTGAGGGRRGHSRP